jgi:membrane fusion protein, heavy metal efflux system
MIYRPLLIPLLSAMIGMPLSAAEAAHDDHAGHDHAEPSPVAVPATDTHDHAGHDHDHDLFMELTADEPAASEEADAHDHDHDHDTVTAAPKVQEKAKPHVHGAHEDEDEHGHDDHGDEHVDEVSLPTAIATASGIVVAAAQARVLTNMVVAPAWVTYHPAGQAQMVAPTAAVVTAVHAQIGDVVEAGQALVELSSPAYVATQSNYVLKRAALIAAKHRVDLTAAQLARGREAGDSLAKAELMRREGDARQAEIEVVQAEAELAAAWSAVRLLRPDEDTLKALRDTLTIADTLTLRAPIAGTVIDRQVMLGQQVDTSTAALLTVADVSHLWVIANIPETQVATVTNGSHVELFAFDGTHLGAGMVAAVAPGIDPHTRSDRAHVTITGTPEIRPGMYVQARITPKASDATTPVVAVPESAVMQFEGGSVVFTAEHHGDETHFRAQPIVTGPAIAGFIPVLSGLAAGTDIVVKGAFLIKADLGKAGAAHEH